MTTTFDPERGSMTSDRRLRYEVVSRMRESAEMVARDKGNARYWEGRRRAFDEIYTEIKGIGLGMEKRRHNRIILARYQK